MLLEPLRHINNPDFGTVLFRRTYPEITNEGGMWDDSQKLYPLLGARPNQNDLDWTFPSGARVSFAHLQRESSIYSYQGAQIPLIGFDQLEHFTERMFFYMLSRNRSVCGVRPYVRGTCNPDADSWLAEFLAWWIDQETGYAILERAGCIRYFARVADEIQWGNSPEDLAQRFPVVNPETDVKSVTFIPATIYDNQILLEKDPGYLANLKAMAELDRERLLGDPVRGGNWKVRPAAGKVFNRDWFDIVPSVPKGGQICAVRFFDFASTETKLSGEDPDYTAGVLMCGARKASEGIAAAQADASRAADEGFEFCVLDAVAEQLGPAEVDSLFFATVRRDVEYCRARSWRYAVRWEEEPGSASKRESRRLIMKLPGIDAKGIPARGDKIMRAKPLIAQAQIRNVPLLAGAWNERWLTHMHNQPAKHDDIMDASSGAFDELTKLLGQRKARSRQG